MTQHSALPQYTDYDSILQVFKTYAARHHDRVFIRYQSQPTSSEYKFLTYGQVDSITTYLANIWEPTFLHKGQEEKDDLRATVQEKKCLAVLNDDPVQSVLTFFATLKLGLIYLPLGTHDSDAAVIHLLQKTDARYLVTSEACYHKASRCAREIMAATTTMTEKDHPTAVTKIQIKIWNDQLDIDEFANNIDATSPLSSATTAVSQLAIINYNNNASSISSLENKNQEQTLPLNDDRSIGGKNGRREETLSNDIVVYMHTSGSTSLPKLVAWNTRSILYSSLAVLSQQMDDANVPFETSDVLLIPILLITGPDIDFLLSTMVAGSSIVVFYSNNPKPADLLAASEMFHATLLFAPPIIFEQLAKYLMAKEEQEQKQQMINHDINDGNNHHQKKISILFERMKLCVYFGAMLCEPAIDFLRSKGLNLQNLYGITGIRGFFSFFLYL